MLTPASLPIWFTILFTVSGISELMRTVTMREPVLLPSPIVLEFILALPLEDRGVMAPLRKSISVILDMFLWSRESEREIIRSVCLAFANETRSPWLRREFNWRSLKNSDISSLELGGVAIGKLASEVAVLADASPDQSVGESGGHSEDDGVYEASSGVGF